MILINVENILFLIVQNIVFWINNQCVIRDKECLYYKGNSQEECEIIIPTTDTYESKCVYKNGICQSEKKNSCKDY